LLKHDDQRAFFLKMLTLEFGFIQGQANLEWLISAFEWIEAGDYDLFVVQFFSYKNTSFHIEDSQSISTK